MRKAVWFESPELEAEVIRETEKAYLLSWPLGQSGFDRAERWIPKSAILLDSTEYSDDICERHEIRIADWWLIQERIGEWND